MYFKPRGNIRKARVYDRGEHHGIQNAGTDTDTAELVHLLSCGVLQSLFQEHKIVPPSTELEIANREIPNSLKYRPHHTHPAAHCTTRANHVVGLPARILMLPNKPLWK